MSKGIFLKEKWWVVCFIIFGIVFSSAVSSYGGKIKKFSAEQVSIAPSGKIEHVQKLYVTPDKIRIEGRSPTGEGTMVMIFHKDLNVHWMINPDKKTYFERSLNEKEWEKLMKKNFTKKEEDLGTETINGFKCRKKRVETTMQFMGREMKSSVIVWVSNRLDMPLRTKTKDGYIAELRNIKKGRQPAKLFNLPKGYQKVNNMFEVFAGPSPGDEAQASDEDQDQKKGFKLPEDIRSKLPKGFKLPFGSKE